MAEYNKNESLLQNAMRGVDITEPDGNEDLVRQNGKNLYVIENVDMGDGKQQWFVWAKNTPTEEEIKNYLLHAILEFDYGYNLDDLILDPEDEKFDEQPENGEILWALDMARGAEVFSIYAGEIDQNYKK